MNFIKDTNAIMASGSIKQPLQESVTLTGYVSKDGSNRALFRNKDTSRSNEMMLVQVDPTVTTFTKYKILKTCSVIVSFSNSGNATSYSQLEHYDVNNILLKTSLDNTSNTSGTGVSVINSNANVGDYFVAVPLNVPSDASSTIFSITATAIEQSQPNLVVNIPSPTTENNYYIEAAGNAGQPIKANITDIPFILSSQSNLNWLGDKFIAPIDGRYSLEGIVFSNASIGGTIYVYVNDIISKVAGVTQASHPYHTISTSINLLAGQKLSLRSDTEMTLTNSVTQHILSITRFNGSYKQTFIGNVQQDYQYDLTVTGNNGWATGRAVGVVYKMGSGQYRLKFNIFGLQSSVSSNTIFINGVTFKTIPTGYQALSNSNGGGYYGTARAESGNNNISIYSSSAAGSACVSGDVELESKPAWATYTN